MSIVSAIETVCASRDWIKCRDFLGSRANEVIAAARTPHSRNGTELLGLVEEVTNAQCAFAACLLLAVQSEEIFQEGLSQYVSAVRSLLAVMNSEQMRLCQKELVIISHRLVNVLCRWNRPSAAILPLITVVDAIVPSPHCLSAIHADILQVLVLSQPRLSMIEPFGQACISGRQYAVAIDFMDTHPIREIAPKHCALPSVDYLRYFFYAGICYFAVNRYQDALDHFIDAISAPATALSAVVMQAVKKARLTSLIVDGRDLTVPQYDSFVVVSG